jgi:site-specific DNA-methyltransferase (adenine-specific)
LGRFPANIIHDGSPEVLALFPETSKSSGGRAGHTAAYSGGYKQEYYGDGNPGYGDKGSAARFFYCAKASKVERDLGCELLPHRTAGECTDRKENTAGLNSPRAGAGRTSGAKNRHPTVKPLALMEYLIKMCSRKGATVLDPFMGSGSTGIACKNLGREFIGYEIEKESFDCAYARIMNGGKT